MINMSAMRARLAIVTVALLGVASCSAQQESGGKPRADSAAVPSTQPADGATRSSDTSARAADSATRVAQDSVRRGKAIDSDAAHFVKPVVKTWTGDLDGMVERRTIRVLITPTRTQYWFDRGHQIGSEYDLLTAFEGWINRRYQIKKHIKTRVVLIPTSRDDLIPGLVEGRGDIAAGVLTFTSDRAARVNFGGPFYRGVRQVAVTGPESPPVNTTDDLSGKRVLVRRSSAYWTSLEGLNRTFGAAGKAPVVLVPAHEDLRDDDILEMVGEGLADVTVVDRYKARLWAKVIPQLRVVEKAIVNDSGEVGWLIRKDSPRLEANIDSFALKYGQGTAFGNQLVKKYTGTTKFVKDARSPTAVKRFRATVDLFRKYGARYDLDYLMMLAQGYQESELKQSARSRVGAIGIMQVMPATGKSLKVGDITEAEPNIHAGVKFLRAMINEYFASEPMDSLNKMLFAFAAYNAGPGRVRGLRREAAKQGLDPNLWFNNVELIAAKRIGAETVGYVSNIYKYYIAYTLLEQQEELAERARTATSPSGDSLNRRP